MNADVVVVGGGVAGLSAAYELARLGASVRVLERRGSVGAECSAGNAGMVASTHAMPLASPGALFEGLKYMWRPDSPFYIRPRPAVAPWLLRYAKASTPGRARGAARLLAELTQTGLEMHRQMVADGMETGLQMRGHIDVYQSQATLDAGRAEIVERAVRGLPGELMSPEELVGFDPELASNLAGGAYYPDQAWCDPTVFAGALADAARSLGAVIENRVEVLGMERRAGRIDALDTTIGRVTADYFVIASGVWSAAVVRGSGLYLPLEGGKGYHVEFPAATADVRVPVYMADARVVATPLAGRLRLSGTLELDGLDDRINPLRVRAITRDGVQVIPGLAGIAPTSVWRGLRPCAPDGLPLVGRVEATPNLLIDAGHGIGGITTAPVTAKLIGEVLRGAPTSLPISRMRPDRFRPLLPRARGRNGSAAVAIAA